MKKDMHASGILLPISSLPSPYGIGTLGKESYAFVDFLHRAGSTVWQILPLGVTSYGDSPYQSFSAKGLNYYFIDVEDLVRKGLLTKDECESHSCEIDRRKVSYGLLFEKRLSLLKLAFSRFDKADKAFAAFVREGAYQDFAFYMALKVRHGFRPYYEWTDEYRTFSEEKERAFIEKEKDLVLFFEWTQFVFLSQYRKLKAYANERGIAIMGDIPLYLSRDSIECYKYPKLFLFDQKGDPTFVAGCPPDYFAPKGQLWGNPIYDWADMAKDGFSFFHDRMRYSLALYDILRIDHFRGLAAYYRIPYGREDAVIGEWVEGPGIALFDGFKDAPIVAEDLGFMDDKVRTLLRETGFPGMKVLQFALDGSTENEHLPSNCNGNHFSYTGTHDNQTILGYVLSLDENNYANCRKSLQRECQRFGVLYKDATRQEVAETCVRLSYHYPSLCNIVPIQDLLLLDDSARMNTPSTLSEKNWTFRTVREDFTDALCEKIRSYRAESKRD